MHLTDHITDVQLDEYLDNEIKNRAKVESHLFSCDDCAERLAALRVLFAEIESLPELELSRDIAAPITRKLSGHAPLSRSLHLTVTLQALAALAAVIFAAPFVTQFASSYLSSIQVPSLADLSLQLQSQWITWLDLLSQFYLPTVPEIPKVELSSLFIMLTVAGVSFLWLVGNGLLLRKQIK